MWTLLGKLNLTNCVRVIKSNFAINLYALWNLMRDNRRLNVDVVYAEDAHDVCVLQVDLLL